MLTPFDERLGGTLLRRFLPIALFVPLVIGWLCWSAQRAGWSSTGVAFAVFAVANIVVYGALVWWAASVMDRADAHRRLAGEASRRSEARFRATFDQAAVGIAHVTPDGRLLRVNRKLCEILGYEHSELQDRTFHDLAYRPDSAADAIQIERLMSGEIAGYSLEKRYLCRNGSLIWINLTVSLVRTTAGAPDYFIAVLEDAQKRRQVEDALRANEERLRLALLATRQGTFDVDLRRGTVLLSAEYMNMLGHEPVQVEESCEQALTRWHSDERQRMERIYAEYKTGERDSHHEELRPLAGDGACSWVLSVGKVVEWDEADRPVRVVGMQADISERKRAEQALRESEHRFRALIEHSLDSIAVIDADNRITYLSPSAELVEGYAPEELVGRNGLENTHPDDIPLVGQVVQQLLANPGKAVSVLWRRRHKDGRWLWLSGFATNLLHDPIVRGIVTNYHDVTERKQAEEALIEERTLLQTLLDALPDIVYTKDAEGRFVTCNRAELTHLGLARREDVIGKTVFDFYPRDLAEIYHADDLSTLDGYPVFNREELSVDANGNQRWHLTIKVPLRNPAGRIVGLVGISRDISERKRTVETQLRSQKMEALGTLAGGIAHDFNNLLLVISGNTALTMSDLPADHAVQEFLREVSNAASRAADLVRQILSFTRQQDSRLQMVQLNSVVKETVKLLRATLPAHVEIATDLAADIPPVSADVSQVNQLLLNLATNSVDAIGEHKGRIHIKLSAVQVHADTAAAVAGLREGRYAKLSVEDNGCGMEPGVVERIFDPFFTTKPQGQGTGLGLSAVHGIMRGHGGAVAVHSKPGDGTVFELYFPAAAPAIAAGKPSVQAQPPAVRRRILYVDDELALVHLATRVLRRLGYEIAGYTDAAEALQVFEADPAAFDAVVTDLSMPGMSGFDFARAVLARRPDIPVVLTSGYVRPQDQETAARVGIREVILKPNTIEDLGEALVGLLNAEENQPQHGGRRAAR